MLVGRNHVSIFHWYINCEKSIKMSFDGPVNTYWDVRGGGYQYQPPSTADILCWLTQLDMGNHCSHNRHIDSQRIFPLSSVCLIIASNGHFFSFIAHWVINWPELWRSQQCSLYHTNYRKEFRLQYYIGYSVDIYVYSYLVPALFSSQVRLLIIRISALVLLKSQNAN